LVTNVRLVRNVKTVGYVGAVKSVRQYPEAGLLKKSSNLAPALGVSKFTTIIAINLVTLSCVA
jgi:hypothetical protein